MNESGSGNISPSPSGDISPSTSLLSLSATIGIGIGSMVLICLVLLCCGCCVLICVKHNRKRKKMTLLQNMPKFRVLDVPNPGYNGDNGVAVVGRAEPLVDVIAGETIPLTESTQPQPVSTPPYDNRRVISVEYSYVLPDQIRSGNAYLDDERPRDYSYASAAEIVPENRKSKSDIPSSPLRIASPYSEPVVKYGSTSSSPLPLNDISSVHSPKSATSPSALSTHYMTPATDEQTLYAQIESLSVLSIDRDVISLAEPLGTGNFGVVLRGLWETSSFSEPIAAKTLKANSSITDKIKFLQEAAIMGQFHHPNIVKLYGVVTVGEPIMLVLELMTNGDLKNYLQKLIPESSDNNVDLTVPPLLLGFCRQIASGMKYLSKKCFIHRDLAARNILLSEDLTCKVGDFGLARDLMDEDYYISKGGKIPIKWTAPEALSFRKYSSASDVWSYGVLVFEIWSLGKKPFSQQTNQQTLRQVEDGYRLPPPPGCPRMIYKMMITCWNPETSRRPSFEELEALLSGDELNLLQWSDEDRAVHPQASLLGVDLSVSENLYSDLQMAYISSTV